MNKPQSKLETAYNLGKEHTHLGLRSDFAITFPRDVSGYTRRDEREAHFRINEIELEIESASLPERLAYKVGKKLGEKDKERLFTSRKTRTKDLEVLLQEGLMDDIEEWHCKVNYDESYRTKDIGNHPMGKYFQVKWFQVGLTYDNLLEFSANFKVADLEKPVAGLVEVFRKHGYIQVFPEEGNNEERSDSGPFYFKKPGQESVKPIFDYRNLKKVCDKIHRDWNRELKQKKK